MLANWSPLRTISGVFFFPMSILQLTQDSHSFALTKPKLYQHRHVHFYVVYAWHFHPLIWYSNSQQVMTPIRNFHFLGMRSDYLDSKKSCLASSCWAKMWAYHKKKKEYIHPLSEPPKNAIVMFLQILGNRSWSTKIVKHLLVLLIYNLGTMVSFRIVRA